MLARSLGQLERKMVAEQEAPDWEPGQQLYDLLVLCLSASRFISVRLGLLIYLTLRVIDKIQWHTLKPYTLHRVRGGFIVTAIAYWVTLCGALDQGCDLGSSTTSWVMGHVCDFPRPQPGHGWSKQCAPFQFWYSLALPPLTSLLQTSGKPERCSQWESRYPWTRECLVSTVRGGHLEIQPIPWEPIRGKERLTEHWVWHFHYCHDGMDHCSAKATNCQKKKTLMLT